ncbi:MAG TPA: hypothetical protein VF669_00750 [Tepidisphaeraceae bacterium]
MRRRILQVLKFALLLALTVTTIGLLVLRARSWTKCDRGYRAKNATLVQLSSREGWLRLVIIHRYPQDERLTWATDELGAYLPNKIPAAILPMRLRLTLEKEEQVGPLVMGKGVADRLSPTGFSGFAVALPLATAATKPAASPFDPGAFTIARQIPPKPAEPSQGYSATISAGRVELRKIAGQSTSGAVAAGSLMTSGAPPMTAAMPCRSVLVPHWLAALVLGLWPVIWATILGQRWFLHAWRRRRRLCLNCGYDLRGSSERCPECNSPVNTVAEAAWAPAMQNSSLGEESPNPRQQYEGNGAASVE